jgi:ABC-type branched-subunit amino acid transport system substrate-binding protein
MPATFDLTGDRRIFCGADYTYGVTLKDGANAAINLTGCTLASQIRRTQSSSEVLASFTVTITDAAAGKATLALFATTTGTLPATPADNYWKHDVLLTRADGVKIRILEGNVEVDAAVTR